MYGKYVSDGIGGHFSMNMAPKGNASTEVKRLLFIDSRDMKESRDYKSPFDFVVKLEDRTTTQMGQTTVHQGIGIEPYKNISKMELKTIGVPKMDNNEHYIILDIAEINDHLDSTDKGSHRASCVVNYDTTLSPGTISPAFENFEFAFTAPLQVLSQLHIKLKKYGGKDITPADFGPVDFGKLFTTMMFEIVYNPLLF